MPKRKVTKPIKETTSLTSRGAGEIVATEAGTVGLAVREETEIKAGVLMARQFPRDEGRAYLDLMQSCQREDFARDCFYRFPRAKTEIMGPTVKLAREAARCWGNIRFGLRLVASDGKMLHVRGVAFDLQNNNMVEMEDRFKNLIYRARPDNRGRVGWVEPDERDQRELVNRRGAICVRNAILQVIPPYMIRDAVAEAQQTMLKATEGRLGDNRQEAVRRMLEAFTSLGVSENMLADRLGHPVAEADSTEWVELQGIYRAITDQTATVEDYFASDSSQEPEGQSRTEQVVDRLKGTAPPREGSQGASAQTEDAPSAGQETLEDETPF